MADETKRIEMQCPRCQNAYNIDVPVRDFEAVKEKKGIVTISLVAPCGHACQIFVDPRFKYRGGQAADIVLGASEVSVADTSKPATNAEEDNADMVLRIASDIITMDARDHAWIKSMGAEEKVDIAELALVTGDKDAAKGIFVDLAEFASSIDDEEFAAAIDERVSKIDLLFRPGESIDYAAVLDEVEQAVCGDAANREKIKHLERLDAVIIDLAVANAKGDITNKDLEYKKERLLRIKERLG
ncbi:MAG: hypothetical protein JW839_06095 [Candidatus Lokiarchaeota archaeon]|nr:hypothetical protein [Candidatus Lokiarchaeota archaeon]